MVFLKTLFISVVLGAAAADAHDVPRFSHKQWQAACGDTYCTLHPQAYPVIAFSRYHDGGPWVLSMTSEWDSLAVPLQYAVDGEALMVPIDQIMPFPAVLLQGNVLELIHHDIIAPNGVSLAGLSAALLWADEQQDRVGQSKQMVLRQPDWHGVAEGLAVQIEQKCDYPIQRYQEDELAIISIAGHPEIRAFGAICWQAAYNIGSSLYILGPDFEGAAPFSHAIWDASSGVRKPVDNVGTDFYFRGPMTEANVPSFTARQKGRGVGDCFTEETYEFDGFTFNLTQRVEDQDCDGKIIPIQTYPQ
jgi:hypothetical protein